MSTKRRRPSQNQENGQPRSKRIKFTLDNVPLSSISSNGTVFVTGTGDVGQLGLGPDILEKTRPCMINMDHEIIDICAGGMHTVCLTKDGRVLTFGCNDEGALGRVFEEDGEYEPGFVELPGKVIQISAGDSHSCALLEDGRAFAWGTFRDSHGNMGLTLEGNEKLPIPILADQHVMKIASGADHLVFLTRFGEVYTCGCAEQGQLGRTTSRGSGRNARNGFGQGQISKLLTPSLIHARLKIHFEDIWAGTYATFAKVAGNDDVYVFGLNNYYQIGLKNIVPHYSPTKSEEFSKYKWHSITCAQHHTIALTKDGKVYAIGRKEYGRLGLGDIQEDAQVLTQIPMLADKKVIAIGCGASQSFAVTDNGDLYGWGMGTGGQLGTGSEDDCLEPTLVKGKQIQGRKMIRVASGGQHTVILALPASENNNKTEKSADKNGTKDTEMKKESNGEKVPKN